MRDRDRLAKTDALTGLYNRYGLVEEMQRDQCRCPSAWVLCV
ncbi:hypothetical protein [Roseburia faecis]